MVRKCNAPLQLTLPAGEPVVAEAGESSSATDGDADGRADDDGPSAANATKQRHIAGFLLAVRSMKLGERATFQVSPELAYGDEGKGAAVGPGETLEFDIELLGVDRVYYRGGG